MPPGRQTPLSMGKTPHLQPRKHVNSFPGTTHLFTGWMLEIKKTPLTSESPTVKRGRKDLPWKSRNARKVDPRRDVEAGVWWWWGVMTLHKEVAFHRASGFCRGGFCRSSWKGGPIMCPQNERGPEADRGRAENPKDQPPPPHHVLTPFPSSSEDSVCLL